MTCTLKRTRLLTVRQTMWRQEHVAQNRPNRKVAVPNLLSRKKAVARNVRRRIVGIAVVKRWFQYLRKTCSWNLVGELGGRGGGERRELLQMTNVCYAISL